MSLSHRVRGSSEERFPEEMFLRLLKKDNKNMR